MKEDKNLEKGPVLTNFSPNLEKLLDSHIGMGKAQYRQILAIAILVLCEGA